MADNLSSKARTDKKTFNERYNAFIDFIKDKIEHNSQKFYNNNEAFKSYILLFYSNVMYKEDRTREQFIVDSFNNFINNDENLFKTLTNNFIDKFYLLLWYYQAYITQCFITLHNYHSDYVDKVVNNIVQKEHYENEQCADDTETIDIRSKDGNVINFRA